MASETKTYEHITRSKIDALRQSLGAFVTLPDADSGAIEGQGMKGSFSYDEAEQTLRLTLDEIPFFVPRGMVWSTVERTLGV